MEKYDVKTFNQKIRLRSKMLAVNVYKVLYDIKLNDLSRIPLKQLMKNITSVAANFSSATRGRSEAEFYAKICIVTEECDECLFWIDFLTTTDILNKEIIEVYKAEAEELLRIFSTIKKKLKQKHFK